MLRVSFATNSPTKQGSPSITSGLSVPVDVLLNDLDKKHVSYRGVLEPGQTLYGPHQYYVNWSIELDGKKVYDLDLKHKTVFIKIDARALGDNLAWMDYIDEFRIKHKCNIVCSTFFNEIFIPVYPDIMFVVPNTRIDNIFAQYYIGTHNTPNPIYQPSLYLNNPLQKIACDILGLDYTERKTLVAHVPVPKNPKKVCLSEHASLKVKEWNIVGGWQAVVNMLVENGYEVHVISKEYSYLKNVINKSGDRPLEERIQDLASASYFIGNSSGLSWLAHSLDCHVFLISDFTPPWHEFSENTTRIYNKQYPRDMIVYEEIIHPVSLEDVLSEIKGKLGI